MFSEEILNYILHGQEETYIEYKDSLNWTEQVAKLKIIQAMLSMANNPNGGIIVIGVKQNGNSCEFNGMNDIDFKTYNYDDVSRVIRNYCDPIIEFKLIMDETEIKGVKKKFVVFQVSESINPTVCIKSEKWNNSAAWLPANIALRKNAIYIRSKVPIESREIATVHEWRELIERTIQKNIKELFKNLPCSGVSKKITGTDEEKYNQDLIKDNL